MTNAKMTKKALLSSALSLVLCISMLLGTTYAWFTDSVTSANNIIQSGNLDIELEYWDGDSWEDVEGQSGILTNELWEPGVTEVAYLRIANAGTLAFKYQLGINIMSEIAGVNVAGEPFKLSDYIKFGVAKDITTDATTKEPALFAKSGDAINAVESERLIAQGLTKTDVMEAGDEFYFALVVWMPTTVGNEANHNGVSVPQIDLGINILATQHTYEKDSFGDQYDKDATYPIVSYPSFLPIESVAENVVLSTKGMDVEIPATLIENLPDEVTSIRLVTTEPIVEDEKITFPYVSIVDQDGKAIDLDGNTTPISITLPAQTKFAYGTTVAVYHDNEMVDIASVEADGTITYSTTHFSKVDVSTEIENSYLVEDSEGFYTEVYYGGTIIPTEDIQLHNFLVTTNQADIYLNGKTITAAENNFVFYAPVETSVITVNGIGTVNTNTGYASYVTKSGKLIVNGGTFNLGNTNEKGHFYTQNNGTTVINGGTFISNDANTPILYCINGFIEINGGFFQNTANPTQALLGMGNNLNYVNNQKITLRGGTFVNWNPMDSAFARPWTNPDVPALIVLADGYQMISETQANGDVWYMVVPA